MLSPSLVLVSDQSALQRAMDVIANNVANSSTTGFKRQGIEFDTLLSQPLPGQKINFVTDRATYRDPSTGPIEPTGNPLDLAIEGTGYFAVQLADGSTRYTRNGSFALNGQGQIVNQAGYPVLNDGNAPIIVPATVQDITVTADGTVSARVDNSVDLSVLGKLEVVNFPNEQQMQPQGNGLYATNQAALPAVDSGIIVQGSLEASNVQSISEMTDMIKIQRAYEQTANLISQENQRLDNALNILGRTTAS